MAMSLIGPLTMKPFTRRRWARDFTSGRAARTARNEGASSTEFDWKDPSLACAHARNRCTLEFVRRAPASAAATPPTTSATISATATSGNQRRRSSNPERSRTAPIDNSTPPEPRRRKDAGRPLRGMPPPVTGGFTQYAGSGSTRVRRPAPVQPRVDALGRDELFVATGLDDAPGIEHQHVIGVLGGREPVRDAHRRAAARDARERTRQRAFGLGIDRARRLVEHEQPGITQLGARQGNELTFSDRQGFAALPHHRLETVG